MLTIINQQRLFRKEIQDTLDRELGSQQPLLKLMPQNWTLKASSLGEREGTKPKMQLHLETADPFEWRFIPPPSATMCRHDRDYS